MLVEQVCLAEGKFFLFWKKNICLQGPRNSYWRVSVWTYKVRCTLKKVGEYRLSFSKASAHHCARGYFVSHWSVCLCLCSFLYDNSPLRFHSPLFIVRHSQASCVVFYVFCKSIMLSKALAFNIHLNHLSSTAVVFFPFWGEKGRLTVTLEKVNCYLRDGRGKVGV